MSSSASFVGPSLSVASAQQLGASTVRVTFTLAPLAVSSSGGHDALNPLHYLLSGPATNSVASVAAETATTFLLTTLTPLVGGTWTITCINIQTASGSALVAPTSASFSSTALAASTLLSGGAQNDTPESILRKHLSPALKGRAWDALMAALAVGDQYNQDTAKAAFDQLFVCTASGLYLDRRGADRGVTRPATIGISDDVYRKLTIKSSAKKLVMQVLLEALETYYGADATRANLTSDLPEPFAFQVGDTVVVQVDEGQELTVAFEQDDFRNMGQATAVEVAAAINRSFRNAELGAYAVEYLAPDTGFIYLRIYTGSLGLKGSIRVRGGRAQNALQFPTKLATTAASGTQWKVETSTASNSIPAGRTRFTWLGGTNPSLTLLSVGDYANLYDTALNAANRGAFPILACTSTTFEIGLTSGADQLTVNQVAASGFLFFTPTRATIQSSGRMATALQGDPEQLEIILPATTQSIERGENTGSYLHVPAIVDITAGSRAATGVVTATAPNHGLLTGQWAEIEGVYPDNSITTPLAFSDGDPSNATTATYQPALAVLLDGRVLVAGGGSTTCYLYNPTTASWSATGSLLSSVSGHVLTVLSTGKVLCTGGGGGAGNTTTQVYDPASGAWTLTGATGVSHKGQSATLLNDGRVLVVGGNASATAEAYTSLTGTWAAVATPNVARNNHVAVKLGDGRVLVAGGYAGVTQVTPLNSAEIYNPINDVWTTLPNMNAARGAPTGTYLPLGTGGKVLVAGGETGSGATATADLFNPATHTWAATGAMTGPRYQHSATILADGRVLVAGGYASSTELQTAELYQPDLGTWLSAPSLLGVHRQHGAVLMSNAKILVWGGGSKAELFSTPFTVKTAGGLNGLFQVTVTSPSTFQYTTADFPYVTTLLSGGTVTPVRTSSDQVQGPFIYDPADGLAITETETTATQAIVASQTYKTLSVVDAGSFPDEEGYLALGFGTSTATLRVRYLGKASSTQLLLDPAFVFPYDLPSGTFVTLLAQRAIYVPENPEEVGSFYATASSAGRVAAQDTIDSLTAAGVNVTQTIIYPGDRGLGNEGQSSSGTAKLSDKVAVWGSDDLDADIAEARET
jgi:hypothetical protein